MCSRSTKTWPLSCIQIHGSQNVKLDNGLWLFAALQGTDKYFCVGSYKTENWNFIQLIIRFSPTLENWPNLREEMASKGLVESFASILCQHQKR